MAEETKHNGNGEIIEAIQMFSTHMDKRFDAVKIDPIGSKNASI